MKNALQMLNSFLTHQEKISESEERLIEHSN